MATGPDAARSPHRLGYVHNVSGNSLGNVGLSVTVLRYDLLVAPGGAP
jgi:hypothetical protein